MIDWEKRAHEALGGHYEYPQLVTQIAAALAQAYGEGLGEARSIEQKDALSEAIRTINVPEFWNTMAQVLSGDSVRSKQRLEELAKVSEQKPQFFPALQPDAGCCCTPCVGVRSAPFLSSRALRPGIDRVPSCHFGCAMCKRINEEPAQ